MTNPPDVAACMTVIELLRAKKLKAWNAYQAEMKLQSEKIRVPQTFDDVWNYTVRDHQALADASAAILEYDEQLKVLWKIHQAWFAQ